MEAEDEDESLKIQLQQLQQLQQMVTEDTADTEATEAAQKTAEAPEAPQAPEAPEAEKPGAEAAPAVDVTATSAPEAAQAAQADESEKAQPSEPVAEVAETAAEPAEENTEADAENGTDMACIVPQVTYDEKSHFTKEGRWVLPKRSQFPSIFCPLRVRVRLASPHDVSVVNPYKIPVAEVEKILRDSLGFKDLFIRFDDCRDRIDAAVNAREVVVAINGELPEGLKVGTQKQVEKYEKESLSATVVDVLETSNDLDPERINSLTSRLKESEACDALVLELPQIWIISDPEFRAKSASIGLYPGSFWMGFLKSWGAVKVAEVFFKKIPGDTGREPMVSVAVQFREQENLRMCFTFLHDRYLVHPKQKNALRQPWGRLVAFEDFKSKTLGRPAQKKPKAATKPQLQINRPMPQVPRKQAAPAKDAKATMDFDHELTPAEAMAGLSGRTLEAFQMVMSRMERLERENKELMQVLIQMQGLLQQSQQRNEQLAGIARADPSTNSTARVALEAQRHAMMASSMVPPPVPPVPPAPVDPSSPEKRPADAEASQPEAAEAAEAAEPSVERPWKHQRRRQRRSAVDAVDADPHLADVGDEDEDQGSGLAAYHNALLGVS